MSPFVWRGGRHLTRIFMTSSSDCVTVTSRGAELGAATSDENIINIHQSRHDYSCSMHKSSRHMAWPSTWCSRLAEVSPLTPRTSGKACFCSNACPWPSNRGTWSPSRTRWSVRKSPLQPLTFYFFSHAYKFCATGQIIIIINQPTRGGSSLPTGLFGAGNFLAASSSVRFSRRKIPRNGAGRWLRRLRSCKVLYRESEKATRLSSGWPRALQGPKFKIPLPSSRPTEYECHVSSTLTQRSRSIRVRKCWHRTDGLVNIWPVLQIV